MQALDTQEWCRFQTELAAKAVTTESLEGGCPTSASAPDARAYRLVGGFDITPAPRRDPHALSGTSGSSNSSPGNCASDGLGEAAVASLVVLSMPGLQPIYQDDIQVQLTVPYIPGFLGFREVPAYKQLLQRAASCGVSPDVLLVDGFGVLHPRRCGAATHLGVLADIPTVGVAKNLLHVDGLVEQQVRREMQEQQHCSGAAQGGAASVLLRASSGEVLGAAVCSPGTQRPVYVSVGHRISLDTAVKVVLRCCRHRVPEPIRLADLRSRHAAQRLLLFPKELM